MVGNNRELPKTLFPFIWHFLCKFKAAVSFYVFLCLIAGFWGPFNSTLIKNVINLFPQVQNGDASILFIPVSLIVLNFIIFDNFTWNGITYIRAKFTPVIINRMLDTSVDYVLGQSRQFFQDNLSGKISNCKESMELQHPWVEAPSSEEKYKQYIQRINFDLHLGFFIRQKSDGQLIAVVNINKIVKGAFQSGYLGYYAFKNFIGQGLMTEQKQEANYNSLNTCVEDNNTLIAFYAGNFTASRNPE